MSSTDAVEYGLNEFRKASDAEDVPEDLAKEVARCYGAGKPLDALLTRNERLPTSTVEQEIKAYMATELRRLARERRVGVEELCDVTARTVRSWASCGTKVEAEGKRRHDSDDLD